MKRQIFTLAPYFLIAVLLFLLAKSYVQTHNSNSIQNIQQTIDSLQAIEISITESIMELNNVQNQLKLFRKEVNLITQEILIIDSVYNPAANIKTNTIDSLKEVLDQKWADLEQIKNEIKSNTK